MAITVNEVKAIRNHSLSFPELKKVEDTIDAFLGNRNNLMSSEQTEDGRIYYSIEVEWPNSFVLSYDVNELNRRYRAAGWDQVLIIPFGQQKINHTALPSDHITANIRLYCARI